MMKHASIFAVLTALTAFGCSTRTEHALVPERKCQLPLSWSAGQPRPQAVRVENRSDREALIFLDQCDQHERVGAVAAGRTRTLTLPDRLVPFPGGLRFHVFPGRELESSFAVVLPLDTARLLDLNVPEQPVPSCKLGLIVDGVPSDAGLRSIPREDILKIELVMAAASGIEEGASCPRIEVVTKHGAARP